jgi:hypothetical protein
MKIDYDNFKNSSKDEEIEKLMHKNPLLVYTLDK